MAQAQPLQQPPPFAQVLPDGINMNEVRNWLRNNQQAFGPGGNQLLWNRNNVEYTLVQVQNPFWPWKELYEIQRVDRDAAGRQILNQAGMAARMMYQIAFRDEPNHPNRYLYYGYHMAAQGGWQQIGGGSRRKRRASRKSSRSRSRRQRR